MNSDAYLFKKRTGETLVKPPGSINGNGFMLDTLHNCEVYLLDHTSQVQIDDCVGCKIFVGPTDGSVFLRDCRDCTLCVAARQLRTRDCKDLDIALFCATQPSIETSTGIVFSCWRGAYPGLTDHFQKARLDPTKNTWRQVYDFNRMEDLGAEHFRLDESVRPWWTVPPVREEGEGAAAPDCPVPAADGSLFGGGQMAPLEQLPPKPPPGALTLPASLPPSPGRAAAYDEEIELEDDEDEPITLLPPGVEDGGRSFVTPAQPSPRRETSPLQQHQQQPASTAFTFDSPRTAAVGGAGAQQLFSGSRDADSSGATFPGYGSGGDGDGGNPFAAVLEPPTAAAVQPLASQLPPTPPAPAAEAEAGGELFFAATNTPAAVNAAHAAVSGAAVLPLPAPDADARVAWRVANAAELAQRTAQERQAKDALHAEARRKLEALQQTRAARLKQRFATNRAAAAQPPAAASAAAGWEGVAELVELTGSGVGVGGKVARAPAAAAHSKDVTRLRQLMISLKSKRK